MSLAKPGIYIDAFLEALEPDPILLVSEWADKYRVLVDESSAEPGPWSTKRTPYLKDIMDALSATSLYQEVVFMKGSQVGGTECGNNWIGYIIDHAPGPTLLVMPRVEDAKKTSKLRIDPLINSSERLRSKVKDAKSRDAGNTILQKDFPKGTLLLVGGNSAAGVKSTAVRYIIFDEEDEYPGDVQGQGDLVALAKKRANTFQGKKKFFHISTPTVEGRSRIENNYNRTDQRYFYIPCPECDHMQTLEFNRLKWDKGKPKTVHYVCENCDYHIKNWQKTKMLERGEWRATSEGESEKIIGFHLSALYSPVGWYSWEECATEWDAANNPKDIALLTTFINTVLGQSWIDKGDAPEWEKLYKARQTYEINSIPEGVCFLTAGVDIQGDRIECEIVGWGRGKRSWSIDYRIFEGDTSSIENEPWLQLQDVLGEVWQAPNGVDLDVRRMAVDSGWNTQNVYSWVRQFPLSKVFAVKGSDHQQVTLNQGTAVDIRTKKKKRIKNAVKLFTVGVSTLKAELYGWLKQVLPDPEIDPDKQVPHGFCYFPQYDQEHFKRLTAETRETKWVKGKKTYEWVAHGRNEQLDCRIYARAAASFLGMDRFKDAKWTELEVEVGLTSTRQDDRTVQTSKNKRSRVTIKRRKSKFS